MKRFVIITVGKSIVENPRLQKTSKVDYQIQW
ncbi:hypothetical protein J2736_003830 [Paenibacillus qinlingensis]|uniref:Glutamate 5-kinase n=1 Tax=Paenibacillus qinlingensis TaxID=1837343 RepID=A0ABU1NYQ8_9BACL|nr:hypothetical protein [Paenibacillus qinlingensis]